MKRTLKTTLLLVGMTSTAMAQRDLPDPIPNPPPPGASTVQDVPLPPESPFPFPDSQPAIVGEELNDGERIAVVVEVDESEELATLRSENATLKTQLEAEKALRASVEHDYFWFRGCTFGGLFGLLIGILLIGNHFIHRAREDREVGYLHGSHQPVREDIRQIPLEQVEGHVRPARPDGRAVHPDEADLF